MKILFLDQFSELGGAQRVLLDTVEAALQRDWQPWVALPPGGPLIQKLRSRDVPVIEIPCGPYRSGAKNVADVLRFATDRRRQDRILADLSNRVVFDLIYVNGPRLLPAAASLAALRGTAVLFHAHSHISQPSALQLAGRSLRRANAAVVACSQSVLGPFRRYAEPSGLSVIANGVPDMGFRDREFSAERSWRIGVIGRISPEKGQAEFVRAAAMLQPEFPLATFVVCGAPLFADPAYSEMVQNLSRGLPVKFLGWRDDIGSVLAELDLLVVPSEEEGMARVVVEAFSAGVPVVAFPSGGIPEIISDGENGFLTSEKSPVALASRITNIITSDPEKLHHIAANSRQDWERLYTVSRYQERITCLMEDLVSERRAAPETAALLRHR